MPARFVVVRAGQNSAAGTKSYTPLMHAWHRFSPVYINFYLFVFSGWTCVLRCGCLSGFEFRRSYDVQRWLSTHIQLNNDSQKEPSCVSTVDKLCEVVEETMEARQLTSARRLWLGSGADNLKKSSSTFLIQTTYILKHHVDDEFDSFSVCDLCRMPPILLPT